jgi:hypothetical protein
MGVDSWIALLAAIIAGAVALTGYLLNQLANRRERKSKLFAEALGVIYECQELPFRIRRRASSDPATRAMLGGLTSDVMTKLGFYLAWLHMESPEVGGAYRLLLDRVRRFGGRFRDEAWRAPLIADDKEVPSAEYLYGDLHAERMLCITIMRHALSPWGFLFRRADRKQLAEQRQATADEETRGE